MNQGGPAARPGPCQPLRGFNLATMPLQDVFEQSP